MPTRSSRRADLRLLAAVGLAAVAVGGCNGGLRLPPATAARSAPPQSGSATHAPSSPATGPVARVAFGSFTFAQPAGFTVTSQGADRMDLTAANGASVTLEHFAACSGADSCPSAPLGTWLVSYLSARPSVQNPTIVTQLEPEHSSRVRISDIVPPGAASATAQYGIDYDVVLEPAVAVVLADRGLDSLLVTGSQFISDVDTGGPPPAGGLNDAIIATLRGLTIAG